LESRNKFKKTHKTTPLSDHETITVTHPFLPYSGKQYCLIGKLNSGGKEKLLCLDSNNKEVVIPIEYTNLKKEEFFQKQANERCDFRYEDLLNLAGLLEEIRKSV